MIRPIPLSLLGLAVIFSAMQPVFSSDSSPTREILLRLEPAAGQSSPQTFTPFRPSVHRIEIIEERVIAGEPQRERDPRLSPDHIVVSALDSLGREIARVAVIDPRLIRSEGVNESGRLTKNILYRTTVDFPVFLPDDPGIRTIRIQQPHWTGKEYQFDVLGETAVSPLRLQQEGKK